MLRWKGVGLLCAGKLHHHKHRAERKGYHRGPGNARHFPAEHRHEQQVQSDIQHAAEHQIAQRALGIAHSPQYAAAHVEYHQRYGAGEEYPQVLD
jgi:hypothetical protein